MKTMITTFLLLAASSAGAQTITYTAASCTHSSLAVAASCTLAAPASIGDLVVITSKSSSNTASVKAVLTFSGTASCSKATQVIAPDRATWQTNGSGHFVTTMFACIVTTPGAASPVVTWFGSDAAFTDIKVGTYHTTTSWAPNFGDKVATNVTTESSSRCPTGTIAETTKADDLIVATCDNFNDAQTWGPLNGFTLRANSSRNTTGWYDTAVSSTATQTVTIPLSSSDLGVGMIAAFSPK
jgi:hypothetical protein